MVDLHTHSTASDGTLTPEALVDLAVEKHLNAIALTDHDTLAGIPGACVRGNERGVEVVPGVELSAKWEGSGQMHILGYYVDCENDYLLERLQWLREHRQQRAQRIAARLKRLGVPISEHRIMEVAQGGSIGRPHIARVLVEAGHVGSISEAFDRYLKDGGPAYVEKAQFRYGEVIKLIRLAGGVAVLAHPATLQLPHESLEASLKRLIRRGLQGIEAYGNHDAPAETSFYENIGRHYGLILTGGSDFHGANKLGTELGEYFANGLPDTDSLLEALSQRRPARTAGQGSSSS